uniref:uncharacterized protein LOC112434934 n=1 Tax=Maylandia zebra TaxID=106582 RepID=UPI000D3040EA
YMLPFGSIIRRHSIRFHCYADDTQLYLSMKPVNAHQLVKLQECLKNIKTWMAANFLLLNSDKTEVIVLGPKNLRNMVSNQILTLDGITLASSNAVRNLGVIFDQDMSFNTHIKQICKTAFLHLRNISKVRNILSQSDAEELVHAFITSRLDDCNSLLSGCPKNSLKSLQLIQNAAARVLTGTRKREHISPVLASLHWLPVKSRIEFKILLLTYKVLNNQAPSYLNDLVVPYHPIRALRSRTAGLLVVPRVFKSRMGGRAFSFQAPLLWNQLPVWIRETDTISTFKIRLKTFLFAKSADGPDLTDTPVALLTVVMDDTTDSALFSPESICIVVEDEILVNGPTNLAESFLLLFGYIYALDLQYPKKLELTFTFIQKVVMCLEDNKPLKGRLLMLKNDLFNE